MMENFNENKSNFKVTPSRSTFSLDFLIESSGGDKSFEIQMLNLYLTNTQNSIQHIKHCFAEELFEEISQEAHKLKSIFGIYNMDVTLLDQLELSSNADRISECIHHLEKQILQTQNHVKNLLEKNYEYRPS